MPELVSVKTEGTDLTAQVDQAGRTLARAVTTAMRATAVGLKGAIRDQIQAAGMGTRLGRAVRDAAFPREPAYSPRAVAEVRAYNPAARVLTAFSEGATITPGSGRKALAIPTDKAPIGKYGRPLSAAEAKKKFGSRLRVIHFSGNAKASGALSLVDPTPKGGRRRGVKRAKPVVMYWLVGSVTLAKRLNPEAAVAEWTGRLPGLVAQGVVRETGG